MKKYLSLIVVTCGLLFGDVAELDQNILTKIEILNQDGEYELARSVLKDFETDDNTIAIMEKWVELDETLVRKLRENRKSNITRLNYNPAICSATNQGIEVDVVAQILPIADLVKSMYNGYNYVKGDRTDILAKSGYKIEMLLLKNNPPELFDLEKAKNIMSQYDIIKKSLMDLNMMMEAYIKSSSVDAFKASIPLIKKIKNLKQQVKQDRTNFISYAVVSPYLANADRLICISNAENILGHNKSYLRDAAKTLANGAYEDILLESSQDVRDQFLDVYSALKATAGSTEFKDLKVLQTLSNSVSKDKKTGADLWW